MSIACVGGAPVCRLERPASITPAIDHPNPPLPAVEATPPSVSAVTRTDPPSRLLFANLVAQIAFGLLAMTICLPSPL